jgi:hypothetical protein
MQKQLVAIAFVTAALVSVPLACSSSSNTGGTTAPTGDGGGTGSDGSTGGGDGGTGTDSSTPGDSGGGCVPVGTAGNADGVGKYCASEADCLSNTKATLCATLGGDPTQDFCTFSCTVVDGGADPCGGGGAICDCQGGQCGCVPTSCQ